MFTFVISQSAANQSFRKSLDLGYLQGDGDNGLDEIDYEALKNAPRIDPDAPPPPHDEEDNTADVPNAHAPGIVGTL